MNLETLRKTIDNVDARLLQLLNERASVSIQIGNEKRSMRQENDPPSEVFVPSREKLVFDKVIQSLTLLKLLNKGPLSDESTVAIYREIISASIRLQQGITIAYLGPVGSFTHHAAVSRFGDSASFHPYPSVAQVFHAITKSQVTYAVVPFENSVAGTVTQTLDAFVRYPKVQIRAEIYTPITMALLAACPLDKVTKIYSKDIAFAQCSRWLDARLPNAQRINVESTSLAAELASKELYAASICSRTCASLYSLDILAEGIEDIATNTTRFFILGPENNQQTESTTLSTLLYFTVDHRQPGALCDALKLFKDANINLTKIDSRPAQDRPWHYHFFIECTGAVDAILPQLNTYCLDVNILGMYPNERNQ